MGNFASLVLTNFKCGNNLPKIFYTFNKVINVNRIFVKPFAFFLGFSYNNVQTLKVRFQISLIITSIYNALHQHAPIKKKLFAFFKLKIC